MRRFRLAAEQGDVGGQIGLGFIYLGDSRVSRDPVSAYAWFSIAAAQGNADAKEMKVHVTSFMTQAQITEAQKRSPGVLDALRRPLLSRAERNQTKGRSKTLPPRPSG